MEIITELTTLQVSNRIHAPKLNKDYIITSYRYNEIYKDMLAYLEPIDKNENGFQITFKNLITLKYQVYK